MKPILFDCKEAQPDYSHRAGMCATIYQGSNDMTIIRSTCFDETTAKPHTHEEEQTFIVVKGKGIWRCDDVEYELDEGCIATVPAGCVHTFVRRVNCDTIMFYEFFTPKRPVYPQSDRVMNLSHLKWD